MEGPGLSGEISIMHYSYCSSSAVAFCPIRWYQSTTFCYSKCLGYNFERYSVIFTGDEAFLIVVRHSIIFGISLNPEVKTFDAMVPISGIQNGYDVAVDYSEQFIYWLENPVSFE